MHKSQAMPEQIAVTDFVREAWEDYKSPTTSNFISKLPQCKATVSGLEETLDYDRSSISKMKKSIKALYSSGNSQVHNESYMAENLHRMGQSSLANDNENTLGEAFLKFSIVTQELSALMKNLMQNLSNILMFPLDTLLKGDLKGVKGDLKKPFDKSWKDYENKFNKIEKEKKQLAKEAGLFKTEVTGPEIAEEMEKERRSFQLQMCEYLIKVNEIKTKKGVDLLQNLVKFYQAENNYFQDGLKTIEHFRCYIEDLVNALSRIRQEQDQERWQLLELRDALKESMSAYTSSQQASSNSSGYSLHQLQGNKAHGSKRRGYLLKKSDGKMRKVWLRRKCIIENGTLSISHQDETKEPVKLNLLTCQVKLVPEDISKKCFDLISSSKNRTYHFQAEDNHDMEEWISVLNNAKEEVLMKAFGESSGGASNTINQTVKELTNTIIQEVKRLPGNRACCDCGAPDPEWLSVNLGVLICLECCGVHREMGVHVSRTQSIVIDELGTSQLLLARVVGNQIFNEIMEATLDPKYKPAPTSDMDEKKTFIRAKYEKRRFAIVTCVNVDDRRQDLKQAVVTKDLSALLQVYAEGVDFLDPLPDLDNEENALHLAILGEDGTSLYMVDFIIQNSNSSQLPRTTRDGNSAVHICALHNKRECLKLLLRVQPDLVGVENAYGLTALEVAKQAGHEQCVELLNHAIAGKSEHFENVNVEWDLIQDDHMFDGVDYSDDDLDNNHISTPDKKMRSRPNSMVLPHDSTLPMPRGRDRNKTTDCIFYNPATLPHNKPKGHLTPASSLDMPRGSALASTPTQGPTATQGPNPTQGPPPAGSMGPPPPGTMPPPSQASLRKKAPAPPPPSSMKLSGHSRNTSDPGVMMGGLGRIVTETGAHSRTPSDSSIPPPLPAKTGKPPGSKLVLPPPPEFRGTDPRLPSGKPVPAPRPTMLGRPEGGPTPREAKRPSPGDGYNGRTPSSERLDSTDSSSSERLDAPRPKVRMEPKQRCRAKFNCQADNEDELSFEQGEVIVLVREEEDEWWEGYIESAPHRSGMFPTTFVTMLPN